mmetsp:Transcript_22001/g.49897  ORF Transcript_22001/g.49897 Transcript_22001/m.49897 type:complete len:282 (+) Transcript_22001:103-948(+)
MPLLPPLRAARTAPGPTGIRPIWQLLPRRRRAVLIAPSKPACQRALKPPPLVVPPAAILPCVEPVVAVAAASPAPKEVALRHAREQVPRPMVGGERRRHGEPHRGVERLVQQGPVRKGPGAEDHARPEDDAHGPRHGPDRPVHRTGRRELRPRRRGRPDARRRVGPGGGVEGRQARVVGARRPEAAVVGGRRRRRRTEVEEREQDPRRTPRAEQGPARRGPRGTGGPVGEVEEPQPHRRGAGAEHEPLLGGREAPSPASGAGLWPMREREGRIAEEEQRRT